VVKKKTPMITVPKIRTKRPIRGWLSVKRSPAAITAIKRYTSFSRKRDTFSGLLLFL
jgi:hypothetical protein